MEELKALLLAILQKQDDQLQAIEALRKRIDDLHDPVLQALLEEYIKIKVPPSSPIQDLLNKANKKSS